MSHDNVVNALLTDSYKLVMAYSFFENNMHNDHTAFELFFRKCPFGGQYVIFAGLHTVIEYVSSFKFTPEQVGFLQKNLFQPDANPKFFEWLLTVDTSQVKIRAMKEGSICFPNEPLIAIEGPQVICQLLETMISKLLIDFSQKQILSVNLVSFPSLVATNASRMRQIAGPKAKLIEFGLRRAQGPDGGLSATKYSYLGGFDGSSNVIAGYKFGIPITGTVAHSFITSFSSLNDIGEKILNGIDLKELSLAYRTKFNFNTIDGELASFIAYAYSMPQNFLCLVDTYNTLQSGVPNFICVAFALQDAGYKPRGIRLDSGDLAQLSKDVKALWNSFGRDTSNWVVVASNDINEEALIKFNKSGHEIDIFGIGTNLVTCQKQPALGLVYKLVECKGVAAMKLSEEVEKSTLPCQKEVYRINGNIDLMANVNEQFAEIKEISAVDWKSQNDRYLIKVEKIEKLLHLVWDGKQSYDLATLSVFQWQAKEYCAQQLEQLEQVLTNKKQHLVLLSLEFYNFSRSKLDSLIVPKQIK